MESTIRIAVAAAGLAASLLFAASVFALEPTDRLTIAVGGYANSLGLEGRFDGSADLTGTRFDFSENFALDDRRELALLAIEWSPSERHQLHLVAFEDSRSRSTVIEENLQFQDVTFPLAAEINGRFDVRALDLGYTWWAYRSERLALGAGLGVLDYRARLRLEGILRRGGEDAPLAEGAAEVTDRLRAPVLSLGARWVVTDRVRLRADASALRIGWDGIDGEIYALRLAAEYYPWEHVGFSLGWGITELRAEAQQEDLRGKLTLEFEGLQATARLRF